MYGSVTKHFYLWILLIFLPFFFKKGCSNPLNEIETIKLHKMIPNWVPFFAFRTYTSTDFDGLFNKRFKFYSIFFIFKNSMWTEPSTSYFLILGMPVLHFIIPKTNVKSIKNYHRQNSQLYITLMWSYLWSRVRRDHYFPWFW